MRKPNNYWTKSRCIESASQFQTLTDWKNNDISAYNSAKRNGWLKECGIDKLRSTKEQNYWDFDRCLFEALKYDSKSEWQKFSPSSYQKARRKNWLEVFTKHMSKTKHEKGYWTRDRCIAMSLNYDSRSEFAKNAKSCYMIARKNMWLEDCCKHMDTIGSRHKRMIYCFEFSDNSVYVGLTYSSIQRKRDHLNSRQKRSIVYDYMKKTNLIPEFKELTPYLNKNEAVKKEGEFVDYYRENGWKILNRIKTGGLGGNNLYWTKDKCSQEISKYYSKTEFQIKANGAYRSSLRNGWLNDISHLLKKSF